MGLHEVVWLLRVMAGLFVIADAGIIFLAVIEGRRLGWRARERDGRESAGKHRDTLLPAFADAAMEATDSAGDWEKTIDEALAPFVGRYPL